MDELKPCPFCQAGKTVTDRKHYWTGMRNELLSVSIKHWCPQVPGVLPTYIEVRRKTEADAIAAWNTRTPSPGAAGGGR